MKVLHLCSGNLFGGVERFLVGIAQVQRTHPIVEHQFLLTHEGRLLKELEGAGARTHTVPFTPRLRRPWTIFGARSFARKVVAELMPNVVVSHGAWTHVVLAGGIPKQVPVVFFLHGPTNGSWLDKLAALRPPIHVLTNSEYSKRTVASAYPGIPSQVVRYVLPDQAMPGSRVRVRSTMGIGSEVVLLHVSRLERWKGHTLLLDALALLRTTEPWVLWIAGGAQRASEEIYLAELRESAERLGLRDRVRFLGERSDIPELLSAADIFCQTNLEPEPLGLSIVEALSAGLPIVSTRAGGPSEYLEPSCAVLLDTLEPNVLADRLAVLIEDSNSRQGMGREGRFLYEREFEPILCNRNFAEVLMTLATRPREASWD